MLIAFFLFVSIGQVSADGLQSFIQSSGVGPVVSKVSVQSPIRAGEDGKITLEFSNLGAGLPTYLNLCENVYLVSRDLKIEKGIRAVCGNLTHLEKEKYTLDILVNADVMPGTYGIVFDSKEIIFDQNRNYATGPLEVLQFKVVR